MMGMCVVWGVGVRDLFGWVLGVWRGKKGFVYCKNNCVEKFLFL